MYKKTNNLRMTDIEASQKYPNSYIVMDMDSREISVNQTGTVLFVGDSHGELMKLIMESDSIKNGGVIEGLNLQNSLGGIVASG
jgi:hypothetical protein